MAAPSTRLTWRGVIRGQLRSIKRRCDSLLKYHSKHSGEFLFLEPTEATTVTQMFILMDRKLTQKGGPPPAV
jgi:hypothetical protein